MKHKLFNYLFTLAIIAVTIYILASSTELGIIPVLIKITDLKFLCGGFICMLLYWLSDMLIIKTLFSFAQPGDCLCTQKKTPDTHGYYVDTTRRFGSR